MGKDWGFQEMKRKVITLKFPEPLSEYQEMVLTTNLQAGRDEIRIFFTKYAKKTDSRWFRLAAKMSGDLAQITRLWMTSLANTVDFYFRFRKEDEKTFVIEYAITDMSLRLFTAKVFGREFKVSVLREKALVENLRKFVFVDMGIAPDSVEIIEEEIEEKIEEKPVPPSEAV